MKKIFTFLMMLCMFVGTAWAEVFNGVYTLGVDIPVTAGELASGDEALAGTPKRGFLSYGQKGETTYNVPVLSDIPWKDYKGNSATALENGKYWYIVTPDGGDTYYFYNVGANKFMAKIGNSVQFSEEPYSWTIVKNGDYYNIGDADATDSWLSGGCGRAPGSQFVMDDNEGDGGSKYTLTLEESITLEQVDAQFNETYAAKISEVTTGAIAICDSYDALQGTLETFNNGVEAANKISASKVVGAWKTLDVAELAACYEAFTYNGTKIIDFFTLKNVYEAISANPEAAKVQLNPGDKFTVLCKYIQGTEVKTRGYMVYNESFTNNVYLAGSDWAPYTTAIDAEGIHAEWAMVSFDGKNYIYNVNNKKFMTSQSPVQFSDTPSALHFNNLDNGLWEIQFDNNNQYLSFAPGYGSNPVRTAGSTDEGNRFYIIKTGETADINEVGATFVNAWKKRELPIIGYVGGYLTSQEETINAIDKLTDIFTFEENNERIALTAGYYFIKGTGTGNDASWYITYGANQSDLVALPLGEGKNLEAKHVWSFDKISNEDAYKLKSCNLDKYAQTAGAPAISQVASTFANGYGYRFTNNGAGKFTIKDGNGNVLRTENGGELNQWSNETNETWYIIPATELKINISIAGWATTHLPFDVVLPEDLTAYSVSAINMAEGATVGYATLEDKTSIPANEGAILKGNQGAYTLTIATAEPWTDNNMLEGSNKNIYVQGDAYVLSNKEGIALYKALLNKDANGNNGESHFLNNANKAYLPVEEGTSLVLRFNFGGNTTAIESVLNNGADANAPIYDLSGRRVMNTVKGGIYIQNGKKFIVK